MNPPAQMQSMNVARTVEVSSEQLEEFISRNSLDERAAGALRECPSDLWGMVLDRGDVNECRNPSAVISRRIRDAAEAGSKDTSYAPSQHGERQSMNLESTVEDFVRANGP